MSAATPTKRRPLGTIDANVAISPRSPASLSASLLSTKLPAPTAKPNIALGGSPLKKASISSVLRDATPLSLGKKRTLDEVETEAFDEAQPAPKKLCSQILVASSSTQTTEEATEEESASDTTKPSVEVADEDEPRASEPMCASAPRSISPEASSVFDNSVLNTTQLTIITEPDTDALGAIPAPANAPTTTMPVAAPFVHAPTPNLLDTIPILPPLQPRRTPTREELRQKAEILKLRLSLATYKIRTNQTDVPLDKLQIRPVPGMHRRRTPLPSMSAHTVERATPAQYWYRSSVVVHSGASAPIKSQSLAPGSPQATVVQAEPGSTFGSHDDEQKVALEEQMSNANVLPGLEYLSTSTPPRSRLDVIEEEIFTTSALKGGAAKGLLSLSQGSH